MAETPSGKVAKARMSLSELSTTIGSQLLPVVADLAEWFSKNAVPKIKALADFLGEHPMFAKLAAGAMAFLVVASPLMFMLGGLTTGIGNLVGNVVNLVGKLVGLGKSMDLGTRIGVGLLNFKGKAITAVKGVIGVFGKLVPAIGGVFSKIGAFLMANPWLIAVAGVIVATILIVKHWDKVKAALSKVWDAIKNAAGSAWGGIKKIVLGIVKSIARPATAIWHGVKSVAVKVFGVISKVCSVFKKIFLGGLKVVRRIIKFEISGIIGIFKILKRVVDIVKRVFGKVKDAITNPIKTAKDIIKNIVDKIKSIFSNLHLPKPHIPNLSVAWSKIGKGKASISVPSIKWNAKGGIFKKPTLLAGNQGVGEAGAEAVLPLSGFWKHLDQSIQNTGNNFYITMNVSGAEDPEAWGEQFARSLKLKMRTI